MGRIRTIKPDFFTDADIGQLEPLLRLFFIGLWTEADREGKLKDKPEQLRVKILPYDQIDAEATLNTLRECGFIIRYEAAASGNYTYRGPAIFVCGFEKHQRPNIRETASGIAYPSEQNHAHASTCAPVHADGEGKGREVEKEGKGTYTDTPIPSEIENLQLYRVDKNLCKRFPELLPAWIDAYPGVDVLAEVKAAHAWELASPKNRKVDRPKFLTNWLKRQQDRPKGQGNADSRKNTRQITVDHSQYPDR